MKEFKALTESQLELLEMKVAVIKEVINQSQNIMNRATALEQENSARIERMKSEPGVDIPKDDAWKWRMSTDGKSFEREKEIKKTTVKDRKGKK